MTDFSPYGWTFDHAAWETTILGISRDASEAERASAWERHREAEHAKRLEEKRAIRERLERGAQPRNHTEAALQFVIDAEQRTYGHRGNMHSDHWTGDGRALYSYATPIAYWSDDDVYVSCERYSQSTTQHLSHLTSALVDAGFVMVRRDARPAHPGIYGGYLRGDSRERVPFQLWRHREILTPDDERWPDTLNGGDNPPPWIADNGKWAIIRNEHETGRETWPYVLLAHGRHPVAYIWPNGDTRTVSSVKIPQYVYRAICALIQG